MVGQAIVQTNLKVQVRVARQQTCKPRQHEVLTKGDGEAALARGAARVTAGVRDLATADELVSRFGDRVVAVLIDLNQPEKIAATAHNFEGVDLLINNVGLLSSGGLFATDGLDAIEADMKVNFWGTLAVTRAFLPAVERQKGAIANVLTVVSLASMAGLGGYSASKAASWSMTQALRAELGKKGLRVHAVFPGPVDTEMAKSITLPKTPPDAVAKAILDGIERGDDDIFPDAMATQVATAFMRAPKEVEKMFAAM